MPKTIGILLNMLRNMNILRKISIQYTMGTKYIKSNIVFHHRKAFSHVIILVIALLFPLLSKGTVKQIGVPVIQNFKRMEYNAGTQNWSVAQGSNGVLYFGNNSGLLRFDGQFWNLFGVPNGSNIRSVYYSEQQQRLYVGAYNDFGYFTNDSVGGVKYISLTDSVPAENKNFGDIWKIHEGPFGVVFQAFEGLYFYENNTISVVTPRSKFHFSYYINGVLYVFDRENGLMEYRNGFLRKIPDGDFFINTEVWSVLPLNNDEVLIGTANKGLFIYNGFEIKPWDTEVNPLLQEYQIYSSVEIDENHFAFGTIQNGLVICNKQGKVIQIINREKGLQNNTILSMNIDLDGNLWLGLDNGIDYVEINSPISLMQDFYDLGTGYTSITYNNKIYLGTNQGLFWCTLDQFQQPNLNANNFSLVENTAGQVWSLQIINNLLYCGHNNGSYLIEDTKGLQISNIPGCWAFNKIPSTNNFYIEGTYNGMELWEIQNETLKHIGNLKGVDYSCQEIAITPNRQVWVSHAFNGLSLYQFTSDIDSLVLIKKYTVDDGLPSNYMNKIKQMPGGDIVLTTSMGIYQYNPAKDNFYKSVFYNNLFDNQNIQYLQEDQNNNIWYVQNNYEGGVLRLLEDGSYSKVSYPFNKLRGRFIGSFFHFNPIDDSNVLIALEKGFAHYNPKLAVDYRRGFNAVLNSVSILESGKTLYNGLWFSDNKEPKNNNITVAHRDNSLRFTFTGLFFEGNSETLFSYQLDGFDADWSDWQIESIKEYTNLPDGSFTFRVKAKNKYDVVASPQPFNFTILPPWYKSTGAIIGYFILLFIFVWFWILLFLQKVEKTRLKEKEIQKKKFLEREEQHKHEALEAEKEIIGLRNEKLRADMIHKDKELANTAMNLVQKNKQLNKIKVELKKIQAELKEELIKSRIGMIIRKIEKETNNDEAWSIFETNFEQVHEDFLKRLRVLHPDISPKELKLSAYLRMNISSKEIAELMNISIRGVEISRYRLRKKFALDRANNLTDYILSV